MTTGKEYTPLDAVQMLTKHCMSMGQFLLMALDDTIESFENAADGSKEKEVLLRDSNNFLTIYRMMMQPFPAASYKLHPESIAIIEKAEFIKASNVITTGKEAISYGIKDGLKLKEDMGEKH